tara:strand:+ start:232 stop:396 length:165 start_codon:yes stop_codon:yes gene_type:complete
LKHIKIKHPNWIKKRINQGVSWTGAIKLGLFTPKLKKALNGKIEIPRFEFFENK